MSDGYEEVFTHFVPDWKWKSAADYRHRRLTDLSESLVLLFKAMTGGG